MSNEKGWKFPKFTSSSGTRNKSYEHNYTAGSVYFDEDAVKSTGEEVQKCEEIATCTFDKIVTGRREEIDTDLVHQNVRYLHDFLNSQASDEVREQFCRFLASHQLFAAWLALVNLRSNPSGFEVDNKESRAQKILEYVVSIMELVMNFNQTESFLKLNCLETLINELKLNSPCRDQEDFDCRIKRQLANNYLVILQLIVQDQVHSTKFHETLLNACVNEILVPYINYRYLGNINWNIK